MARWSQEHTDRVKKALRAHFDAGVDLSISAYAKAADCDELVVKKLLAQAGIPGWTSPAPAVGSTTPDSGATAATGSDGTPPANPPSGGSAVPGAPSAPSAAPPASVSPEIEALRADMRSLPLAIASAVKAVVEEARGAPEGTSPADVAEQAARNQLADTYVEAATQKALQQQAWVEQAGVVVTKFYVESGLRARFPEGPGKMVEEAIDFWWRNQDSYTRMSREIGFLLAKIDALEDELDPVKRRREIREYANKLVLAALLSGAHLNEEDVILLDELMERQVRRDEARVPVSDAVTNPPRLALSPGGGSNR